MNYDTEFALQQVLLSHGLVADARAYEALKCALDSDAVIAATKCYRKLESDSEDIQYGLNQRIDDLLHEKQLLELEQYKLEQAINELNDKLEEALKGAKA